MGWMRSSGTPCAAPSYVNSQNEGSGNSLQPFSLQPRDSYSCLKASNNPKHSGQMSWSGLKSKILLRLTTMATASWKRLDKDASRVMLKPLNLKRRLNASQPRLGGISAPLCGRITCVPSNLRRPHGLGDCWLDGAPFRRRAILRGLRYSRTRVRRVKEE